MNAFSVEDVRLEPTALQVNRWRRQLQ